MTNETPEVSEVEISEPTQIPPANAWTREGEPDPDTIDQSPIDLGIEVNDK
jgi:hypothetical protein